MCKKKINNWWDRLSRPTKEIIFDILEVMVLGILATVAFTILFHHVVVFFGCISIPNIFNTDITKFAEHWEQAKWGIVLEFVAIIALIIAFYALRRWRNRNIPDKTTEAVNALTASINTLTNNMNEGFKRIENLLKELLNKK
jgi:uncharacterized membrane protein